MTLKSLALFSFVSAFLGSSNVFAGAIPNTQAMIRNDQVACIVTQVDRYLFASGETVEVSARSGNVSCPAPQVVEASDKGLVFYNPLWLTLIRWNGTGWDRVSDIPARLEPGQFARQKIVEYESLPNGRYALTTVSGRGLGPWYFLESINFVVGGTEEDPYAVVTGSSGFDPDRRTPYIRSARVAVDGYLYFRGFLGNSTVVVKGYLYQLRKEVTEFLPVEFEIVDPKDQTVFINQPFVRGGQFDLAWVRVKLPKNSLDPSRSVYASITADGGGITVQGVVYDPTDPAANFFGFNTF